MPISKFAIRTLDDITLSEIRKRKALKKYVFPKTLKVPFETKLKVGTSKDVDLEINKWQSDIKPPKVKNTTIKLEQRALHENDLRKLISIQKAKHSTVEMIKQGVSIPDLASICHIGLTTYRYILAEEEYLLKLKTSSNSKKKELQSKWDLNRANFDLYNRKSGNKNFSLDSFDQGVRLIKKKTNFKDAIKTIAQSSNIIDQTTIQSSGNTLQAIRKLPKSFLNQIKLHSGAGVIHAPTFEEKSNEGLCQNPISGENTYNFYTDISFTAELPIFDFSSWNPMNWSVSIEEVEVLGASIEMGLWYQYEISCKGFWIRGSAFVEVCASVMGAELCAGCTGVVEIGASIGIPKQDSSDCIYGGGAIAIITCYVGGIPIYLNSIGLTLKITAPCLNS